MNEWTVENKYPATTLVVQILKKDYQIISTLNEWTVWKK